MFLNVWKIKNNKTLFAIQRKIRRRSKLKNYILIFIILQFSIVKFENQDKVFDQKITRFFLLSEDKICG